MKLDEIKFEVQKQYQKIQKKRKNMPQYYKCDLHVHSPASKCYVKEIGQSDDEAFEGIVKSFLESELNIIAITDHNTCEGYSKIRTIFNKSREKVNSIKKEILPGVEITSFGFHFLALFSPSVRIENLRLFLSECGLDIYDHGLGEASADLVSPFKMFNITMKYGGVILIPHCEANNGLLKGVLSSNQSDGMIRGKTIEKLLNHPAVAGVFYNDNSIERRIRELLTNYGCSHLKLLKASDSHCIRTSSDYSEICSSGTPMGNRSSWLQMSDSSFEALVATLRNRTSNAYFSYPESNKIPILIGIALENSFLDKTDPNSNWSNIAFANEMNCIIGARGAGKTTILEYLQAFDGSNDIPPIADSKLAELDIEFQRSLARGHSPRTLDDLNRKRRILARFSKMILFFTNNEFTFAFHMIVDNDGRHKCNIFNIENEKIVLCNSKNAGKFGSAQLIIDHEKLGKIESNLLYISQKEIERISSDRNHLLIMVLSLCDRFSNQRFTELKEKSMDLKNSIEGVARSIRKEYLKHERKSDNSSRMVNLFKKYSTILNEMDEIVINCINSINEANKDVVQLKYKYAYDLDKARGLIEKWASEYSFANPSFTKSAENREIIRLLNFFGLASRSTDCIPYYLFLNDSIELSRFIGIDLDTASKLCNIYKNHIRDEEVLFRPEIEIDFEFNIKAGQNSRPEYRKSEYLSYGQKSVCVLSLLINSSTVFGDYRPLLIDQPEDDLDNVYIFTTLVKHFQILKSKRQLIIATHNPNILVSSEAENILVLESDGTNAKIITYGNMDKDSVRENVIKILEGDKTALRIRLDKYKMFRNDL